MPKEVIKEFRDNYNLYEQLLEERKNIADSLITVQRTNNNANVLEEVTMLEHVNLPNEITMIVNVKSNNYNFFQFKLKCSDLSGTPFFRFDSDGDAHRNYDENIPLSEQKISTPHFHIYNNEGVNIAYKTDVLIRDEDENVLKDINLCIKHFCHEANIRLNIDDFPDIEILPEQLRLAVTNEDPNSNVNFL